MGERSPPLQFLGDAVGLPAAHVRRAVHQRQACGPATRALQRLGPAPVLMPGTAVRCG